MKLGNITLPRTAALAPMAGVADRAFREVCAEMGACYMVGEMASAKGLTYQSTKTAELLEVTDLQRPMAVQLFGDEPEVMAQAVGIALQFEPDVIDINMGCPAPKIAGNGSGSALMKTPALAKRIVEAVVAASTVPVTVKIRRGWDETLLNAVEIATLAEEAGAAAITVHGRTRVQMYAPPVDLDCIAAVKQAVSVPVIGNGDVCDVESAVEMYERTGCDLVMIGRGALGNPWVFFQIQSYMLWGERVAEPSLEEKMDGMLRHIKRACLYKGEHVAMREARSHVGWYLKGIRGAAALRRRTSSLSHYDELEALARDVLDTASGDAFVPGGF
ncbi:tRNA dihydrouridine synthase DusB [Ruminococcaceae bacterium OttesenSCG-928-L11]|nr:tRNA dihydrouridine synthase DusB [Ruminococcaceae bacterium OttesenSCG-928-L11]